MQPRDGWQMVCFIASFVVRSWSFTKHQVVTTSSFDRRLSSSLSSQSTRKVAVIGGGLAGIATTFHLLEKQPEVHVTVFDRAPTGFGGASSVAGGLLHPLSPRGKLVHWGMEGLEASNALIQVALRHDSKVQLRDRFFRLAMDDQSVQQLRTTAQQLPDLCEWMDIDALLAQGILDESTMATTLGALRLTNGCQIVHVPSYLQALWKACQEKSTRVEWSLVEGNDCGSSVFWKDRLSEFDAVVLSCGDGLFPSLMNPRLFPVQLVHGQSVELQLPGSRTRRLELGLLSGKYISPTLDESLVLIGATHEFSAELLPQNEVVNELRCRTINMAPHIWELGSVHRVTKGTRVQSRRGKNGRQPIVGKIASDIHTNAWIFTGLSSRGLLYHGLYGEMLAEAVKLDSEMVLLDRCADIFWWRKDPCS